MPLWVFKSLIIINFCEFCLNLTFFVWNLSKALNFCLAEPCYIYKFLILIILPYRLVLLCRIIFLSYRLLCCHTELCVAKWSIHEFKVRVCVFKACLKFFGFFCCGCALQPVGSLRSKWQKCAVFVSSFCKNGVANLAFTLEFWKFFVVKFAVYIENVLAQSLHFFVKFDFKFHRFKRILQGF